MLRTTALFLCLLPLACAPGMPDLGARVSAESRSADFPALVPLGPLLAGIEQPRPRSAEAAGTSLEQRAADLRRRADWLRRLPL